jgi:hypothetical protein
MVASVTCSPVDVPDLDCWSLPFHQILLYSTGPLLGSQRYANRHFKEIIVFQAEWLPKCEVVIEFRHGQFKGSLEGTSPEVPDPFCEGHTTRALQRNRATFARSMNWTKLSVSLCGLAVIGSSRSFRVILMRKSPYFIRGTCNG